MKTYVVGSQTKKRIIDALLMSTHNLHFCGERRNLQGISNEYHDIIITPQHNYYTTTSF